MSDNTYRVKKRFLWWYRFIKENGKPVEFKRFASVVGYVLKLKEKDKNRGH